MATRTTTQAVEATKRPRPRPTDEQLVLSLWTKELLESLEEDVLAELAVEHGFDASTDVEEMMGYAQSVALFCEQIAQYARVVQRVHPQDPEVPVLLEALSNRTITSTADALENLTQGQPAYALLTAQLDEYAGVIGELRAAIESNTQADRTQAQVSYVSARLAPVLRLIGGDEEDAETAFSGWLKLRSTPLKAKPKPKAKAKDKGKPLGEAPAQERRASGRKKKKVSYVPPEDNDEDEEHPASPDAMDEDQDEDAIETFYQMHSSLLANIPVVHAGFAASDGELEAPALALEDLETALQILRDDVEATPRADALLIQAKLRVWWLTVKRALALKVLHDAFAKRKKSRAKKPPTTKQAWAAFLKQHQLANPKNAALSYDQSQKYIKLANALIAFPALRYQTQLVKITNWDHWLTAWLAHVEGDEDEKAVWEMESLEGLLELALEEKVDEEEEEEEEEDE